MNLINISQVKKFVKENNKQISKEALESLNARVVSILDSAIRSSGKFTRITNTEINIAK
jgi:hypothetical protein